MSEVFQVDATDLAIVDELRKNGRATNQQIGETLNLSAAKVSARVRRMEKANRLRIVGASDFAAHGYNVLMEVAVEVDGKLAIQVAEELAEIDEVLAVHMVTGRYDIDLLVGLHSFDDFSNLMRSKFMKIGGIQSMVPAIIIDVIKYQFDVAPIVGTGRENSDQLKDELDVLLVKTLSNDARVSNRKIAAELGVTEGTVRKRLKRLKQEGLIAFTAISNFGPRPHTKIALIGVNVNGDQLGHASSKMAKLPMISAVMTTMGRFNIIAICLFGELDKLDEVVSGQILAIDGVSSVETSIVVKTVKNNSGIVRTIGAENPQSKGD